MRKRIFEIIEKADGRDVASIVYDVAMMVLIVASLVPLAFKEETRALRSVDLICAVVFIVDYLLRWSTADFKFRDPSVKSFLRYPFSPMALVDLVSILPTFALLNGGFKVLRVLRMTRALRVLRVLKAARYSRSLQIIARVFRRSKESLLAVCSLAILYVAVSALVILNVEPDSFDSFFEAVYWATVSLTTVGYGDIYPVTAAGRFITILSSFFGVAIVALPAGIITAGYMEELRKEHSRRRKDAAATDPGDDEDDA